jgi:hypothetical protein
MSLCCDLRHGEGTAGHVQELEGGGVGHVGRAYLCKLQSL